MPAQVQHSCAALQACRAAIEEHAREHAVPVAEAVSALHAVLPVHRQLQVSASLTACLTLSSTQTKAHAHRGFPPLSWPAAACMHACMHAQHVYLPPAGEAERAGPAAACAADASALEHPARHASPPAQPQLQHPGHSERRERSTKTPWLAGCVVTSLQSLTIWCAPGAGRAGG